MQSSVRTGGICNYYSYKPLEQDRLHGHFVRFSKNARFVDCGIYKPNSAWMAAAILPACSRISISDSASIMTRARASVPE